jgi:hypothetical protein
MSDPANTVSLLANETRAAILRELGEHLNEVGEPPSFSTLRERVGVADSGQFNYHLGQLEGPFLEARSDGYSLTPFGARVVGLLFAGVLEGGTRGPVEYPVACRWCGSSQTTELQDGVIEVRCENDHTETHFLPPGALANRDLVAATDLAWRLTLQSLELAVDSICPVCGGDVDPGLRSADEDLSFRADCDTCPVTVMADPALIVLSHPAVQGFLWESGVDVHDRPWALEWCRPGDARVSATDPLRVAIDVVADGETLTVTLNETATVVRVSRSTG